MKAEEKERTYTTVTIGKREAAKLKKLASSFEISQTEFVNKMVWYFEKTGINPADPIETPAGQLAEMNKRLNSVIAFQKEFEKNKLQPILDELVKTDQRLKTLPDTSNRIYKTLKDLFMTQNEDKTLKYSNTPKEIIEKTVQATNELKIKEDLVIKVVQTIMGLLSDRTKSDDLTNKNIENLVKYFKSDEPRKWTKFVEQ